MPSFVIKWSGADYAIDIEDSQTVADMKNLIFNKTGVRPDRQKLLGLKVSGKPAADHNLISELNLKPNSKIMLMGSREEDIAQASEKPADVPEVVNDLDIPEEADIAIQNQSEYLAKIEKRVRDIKVDIINAPRPGKKLLVLDIDYTLFDHRSVAESPDQLMRPYLHEFLTSAYNDYDIVIWCKYEPGCPVNSVITPSSFSCNFHEVDRS
jgi:ubiquitin-like domain-containing CTD phosphatase 1